MPNNHFLPTLAELYTHPDNGKPDVFLAGFASKHNDAAAFITRVGQNAGNKDKFVAYGRLYKWGYKETGKPSEDYVGITIWDDAGLEREFSQEFYTWYQMSEHRWSSGFLAMSLAFQEKCRFLPLQLYTACFATQPLREQQDVVVLARNPRHVRHMIEAAYSDKLVYDFQDIQRDVRVYLHHAHVPTFWHWR